MKKAKKIILMSILLSILQGTITILKTNASFVEDTVSLVSNVDIYTKAEAESDVPTLDGIKKHYYNQLTTEFAKRIYNALSASTGNTATANVEDLNITTTETTQEGLKSWFDSNYLKYLNDGKEAYCEDSGNFWWQTRKEAYSFEGESNGNGITLTKIVLTANASSNYEQYTNFNNELTKACNSITGNTVYEKVTAINKYICDNVEYGYENNSIMYQTAYGALIEHKSVCEGYAQLFNLMCRKKGIISMCVYGTTINTDGSSELHGWNYVYDPDKKQWYAVDCTWNDTMNSSYNIDLNFFMMIGSDTIISPLKNLGTFSNHHKIGGYKAYSNQTYSPIVKVTLAQNKYLTFDPKIQYSKQNNGNIIAQINSNIDLYSIPSGWEISADRRNLTKTYSENVTETVTIGNVYDETKTLNITINNIGEPDPEEIFTSSTYIIENSIIKNIQPDISLTDFSQNITTNQEYTIKEGDNTITGADKIKTGQVLIVGGQTYSLVVTGDVNGDGQANIADILAMNRHRLNKAQLTNVYLQAGDANNDGKVDIKDILQINKTRLGK